MCQGRKTHELYLKNLHQGKSRVEIFLEKLKLKKMKKE